MDMDIDDDVYQADGKVLLFTSKDSAEPAMSITHQGFKWTSTYPEEVSSQVSANSK